MARYIDVAKLLKDLTISPDGTKIPDVDCDNFPIKIDLRLLRRIILRQPTADVVEVKHGEWIKTDRGIRTNVNTGQPMRVYYCDCSCCGWHTGHQGIEFKYCPNCGAKMDGGNKND